MAKFFALLVLLGLFSSCGDLKSKDVVKNPLDSSQFAVDCKLDIAKFSLILHENIAPQIRCLGENLNLFIRVAENIKPGYMSRQALENYILKNRPDITPEMLKALKAVYDLNFLITGDDPNYIS